MEDIMRRWSIVTEQGTAMAEATLCDAHFSDPELRHFAEVWAEGAEDFNGLTWRETTGNDAVVCVECGR